MTTLGFSEQNVYQMWLAGHERGDVWIRRTTWSNLCARIVSVGKLTGPPPYFGNAEVRANVYSVAGALVEENAVIPAAGTYKTWRLIEAPSWARKAS